MSLFPPQYVFLFLVSLLPVATLFSYIWIYIIHSKLNPIPFHLSDFISKVAVYYCFGLIYCFGFTVVGWKQLKFFCLTASIACFPTWNDTVLATRFPPISIRSVAVLWVSLHKILELHLSHQLSAVFSQTDGEFSSFLLHPEFIPCTPS